MIDRFTDYDPLAWAYDRHWSYFGLRVLPMLKRLVLDDLLAGASILDLCCGTGKLAAQLQGLGFEVTGLDGSGAMLRLAKENCPEGQFEIDDARTFRFARTFDAVVSTFDSLNYVMTMRELQSVFRNVRRVLAKGGRFVFDLKMEEGYLERWKGSFAFVEEDNVCTVVSAHDSKKRIGRSELTLFRLDREWQRTDVTLCQAWHSQEQITSALARVGFPHVSVHESDVDVGRSFFVAHR